MTRKANQKRDPRDVPNYTLPEAARWLGLASNTLRVWLRGQDYRTQSGKKHALPVVHPAGEGPLGLSFWNLVECSVLATIRKEHAVSLQKVRSALAYVGKELGMKRPLIEQEFITDGVGLFVDRYGKLIDASRQGQLAMREILSAGLTRIERDEEGLAARLFPWRSDPREPRVVAVDPRIAFGQPILASTRVPIEVVFDRFRAGDTISHLAEDYGVEQSKIEDLVRKWFGPAAA
ncbi:MAG: DUF433 domain-containing protein [Planctomycetes bacterium]|nr:DUF433 domain-containing protein [Planctomycetota bacterium]